VNKTNKLNVNTTFNAIVSTVTCFGYINSHHQSIQKKKIFNIYPQNSVSDQKPYNKFICKISIKMKSKIKYTLQTVKKHTHVRQYNVAVCDLG
jgi:hypothetical protein